MCVCVRGAVVDTPVQRLLMTFTILNQLRIRDFAERCPSFGKTRDTDSSPAQIAHVLRNKQEQLFGMLLAFQEVELRQLEESLNDVERPQDGDLVQFQMVTVQVC